MGLDLKELAHVWGYPHVRPVVARALKESLADVVACRWGMCVVVWDQVGPQLLRGAAPRRQ